MENGRQRQMETNGSELPGVVGGAAYRLETDYIFLAACLCLSPPLSFSSFFGNGNTSKENNPAEWFVVFSLVHTDVCLLKDVTKTHPNPTIRPEIEQLPTYGLGLESWNTFPDMYTIAIVITAEWMTLKTMHKDSVWGLVHHMEQYFNRLEWQTYSEHHRQITFITITSAPHHQQHNTCSLDTLCRVL